jgi:hypothetical protein
LLGAVLAMLFAVGCANPEYDGEAARAELRELGLTEGQARCVILGLRPIGERRLVLHAEPTEREIQRTRAVLQRCDVEVVTDADRSS